MSDKPIAIVCSFDSTDGEESYEDIKAAVLKAGRFSVYEATESAHKACAFDRLCADPGIEIFNMGYPWTGVRLR